MLPSLPLLPLNTDVPRAVDRGGSITPATVPPDSPRQPVPEVPSIVVIPPEDMRTFVNEIAEATYPLVRRDRFPVWTDRGTDVAALEASVILFGKMGLLTPAFVRTCLDNVQLAHRHIATVGPSIDDENVEVFTAEEERFTTEDVVMMDDAPNYAFPLDVDEQEGVAPMQTGMTFVFTDRSSLTGETRAQAETASREDRLFVLEQLGFWPALGFSRVGRDFWSQLYKLGRKKLFNELPRLIFKHIGKLALGLLVPTLGVGMIGGQILPSLTKLVIERIAKREQYNSGTAIVRGGNWIAENVLGADLGPDPSTAPYAQHGEDPTKYTNILNRQFDKIYDDPKGYLLQAGKVGFACAAIAAIVLVFKEWTWEYKPQRCQAYLDYFGNRADERAIGDDNPQRFHLRPFLKRLRDRIQLLLQFASVQRDEAWKAYFESVLDLLDPSGGRLEGNLHRKWAGLLRGDVDNACARAYELGDAVIGPLTNIMAQLERFGADLDWHERAHQMLTTVDGLFDTTGLNRESTIRVRQHFGHVRPDGFEVGRWIRGRWLRENTPEGPTNLYGGDVRNVARQAHMSNYVEYMSRLAAELAEHRRQILALPPFRYRAPLHVTVMDDTGGPGEGRLEANFRYYSNELRAAVPALLGAEEFSPKSQRMRPEDFLAHAAPDDRAGDLCNGIRRDAMGDPGIDKDWVCDDIEDKPGKRMWIARLRSEIGPEGGKGRGRGGGDAGRRGSGRGGPSDESRGFEQGPYYYGSPEDKCEGVPRSKLPPPMPGYFWDCDVLASGKFKWKQRKIPPPDKEPGAGGPIRAAAEKKKKKAKKKGKKAAAAAAAASDDESKEEDDIDGGAVSPEDLAALGLGPLVAGGPGAPSGCVVDAVLAQMQGLRVQQG